MELFSPYELEVRVKVPERHFADFKKGIPVSVTFDAIPGYEIAGHGLVARTESERSGAHLSAAHPYPKRRWPHRRGMIASVSLGRR